MKGMGSDPARDSFFQAIMRLLKRARVPFMIGGGYAFAAYTGIHRDTKDLDVFVKPADRDRALDAARDAGFKTWVKSAHWLGKIERGHSFVDIIYSSGNGVCPVDETWFARAGDARLLGSKILLTPPEEMIWSKAFIMERHRYDGADVAHLLRAKAREMDWDRLIDRFGEHWAVLLSHLIMFRFIYPDSASDVPEHVLARLVDRLPDARGKTVSREKSCRGTLLSFREYLPDVREWGLRDARLKPWGTMSQREIDRWTAERK
jgi:hypothetical protein